MTYHLLMTCSYIANLLFMSCPELFLCLVHELFTTVEFFYSLSEIVQYCQRLANIGASVGVAVGNHSAAQRATLLVATISVIIFLFFPPIFPCYLNFPLLSTFLIEGVLE